MSSSNRKLLENLSFQSIAEFAGKGLQAIYYLYFANVIGVEGNGIYGYAMSIVVFFILIVEFGIDIYGMRSIAKDSNNVRKYVDHIFSLRLFLAFISYSLLALFAFLFIDKEIVRYALLILGFNIFSSAMLLNWVFQGIEKMGIVAVRQVMVSLLTVILIFIFVHDSGDTLLALGIISFSLLINSIIMVIYYINKIGKIRLQFNKVRWKGIINAAVPIGFYSVLIMIMNNVDLTLIGSLLTDFEKESGIYNAAFRIAIFALVPSIVIQNSFFPQLSRSITKEERVPLLKKYIKAIVVVGALVGVITYVYSDFLITSLLSNEYLDSIELMQIFAFSIFVKFINVALASTLVAWKLEKSVLYGTTFAVIFNIIIDLILIPDHGAYGATIATIAAESTLMFVLGYRVYKETGQVVLKFALAVVPLALLSVIPSYYYVNSATNNILGIFVLVIIYTLVVNYSGFFNIFGIKKYLKK
jgi:O-antigen/teichoic acid export membrane protein